MTYVLYGGEAVTDQPGGAPYRVWLDPAGSRPAEARLRTVRGDRLSALALTPDRRTPAFLAPLGLRLYASAGAGPVRPQAPVGVEGATSSASGPLDVDGDLTVHSGHSVFVRSTFDGGDDDQDPRHADSTGRVNLFSYQRSLRRHWGETVRNYLMRRDAKAMTAWYGPVRLYDRHRDAIGDPSNPDDFVPWAWTGAHYESNDHDGIHGHWEVEVPDTTGELRGRLEILFADQRTGRVGIDITKILTNLAHLVVRCSNGQQLRLQATDGNELPVVFTRNVDGTWGRRWKLRTTADRETGNNRGSNFELCRYGDDGAMLDQPLVVDRDTGRVVVGGLLGNAGGMTVRRAGGTALTVEGGLVVDGVPVRPSVLARKPAEESRAAGAARADGALSVPVAAHSTYALDAMLIHSGSVHIGFTGPAGMSCAWAVDPALRTAGTAELPADRNGPSVARPVGTVRTGAAAGRLTLTWARSTSEGQATLGADSWLRLTELD
jgi:hypothetical protein